MSSLIYRISRVSLVTAVLVPFVLAGCGGSTPHAKAPNPLIDQRDVVTVKVYPALQGTIGQFAFFADFMPIPVEGWGVVADLPGTGSGDMSPEVRNYLTQQLYQVGAGSYAKGTEQINPERILASNQIAAVEIHGLIPPLATPGDTFDLVVKCLPDTQTTSLAGGLLWTSPLKIIGLRTDIDTHPLAIGRGPIFIPNTLNAESARAATQPAAIAKTLRSGRVIGGGIVHEARAVRLQLRSPSYRFAAAIERAINSRFPARDKCADALNDSIIELHVPPEYATAPGQFIDLVTHMYLTQELPGFSETQAATLIKALEDPKAPHRELSLALQGLGRSILPAYIQPQYTSSNPTVRFWAARAGAALDDVGGMVVLDQFSRDLSSPLRNQAIQAIIDISHNGDTIRASLALSELLKSTSTTDRVLGYGGLVAIRSHLIRTYSVGKKFLLDVVPSDGPPLIYATQSDTPRIALIGHDFILPPGALYVSPDNLLTVSVADDSAPAPQTGADTGGANVVVASSVGTPDAAVPAAPLVNKDNVTLYSRAPAGDRTVNLKTSSNLPEVIARLAWAPDPLSRDFDPNVQFIGASYQRLVEMLASMCNDQVISAQFILQKAPEPIIVSSDTLAGRPEGSTERPHVPQAAAPLNAPAPAAPIH